MEKFVSKIVIFNLICIVLVSGLAYAEPQSIPNGPWVNPEQPINLEAFMSNEELEKKLAQIEARSKGKMSLDLAYSTTGLPIYIVKFGDAEPDQIRVLIQGQIHGGEPIGAEACMALIQQLALSGNADIDQILDAVTVWIVPRLNVEGASFEQNDKIIQRRWNIQTWSPSEWGLSSGAEAPWYYCDDLCDIPGFDINRDFNPDLDFVLSPLNASLLPGDSTVPGFFVTPEARLMRDIYKELEPDVFIDLQQGGTHLISAEDNSMCTLQLLALAIDVDRADCTLNPAVLEFSKQINAYVYQNLQSLGNSPFTAIQRYADVHLPGTALGAFSCNGTATMLYETRSVRQKSIGMLAKQMIMGITATLKGLADGSIFDVDPAIYDTIPPSGPGIANPHP